MRPPKLKWQHTTRALYRIAQAVEVLAAPDVPAFAVARVKAVKRVRVAVARLRKHVRDSEECEMD